MAHTVTGTTDGTTPSVAGNVPPDSRIAVKPGYQAKEWVVLSCCGQGFGEIYKVKNQKTDILGAMKIENVKKINESTLLRESKIYKALSRHSLGAKYVAEMIAFEQNNSTGIESNYLVITYLGTSLKDLKKSCNDKMELSTILRIGIQTFLGIKMLHDVGYIHRHLRPSSFMLGSSESPDKCRIFHLTDFQMARRYLKRARNNYGIFREEREPSNVRMHGYIRYISVSVHNGNEHRCRDDLWSWIYILAELSDKLPWNNVKVDPSKIHALKMITPDSQLFAASAKSKDQKGHLQSILEYIRTIHADSRPDYAGIYRRLKNAMNVIGSKFSDPYDWESGEQSVDGFLTEADHQKYFAHEEMQIIRKGDNKGEVDGTSFKDESSPRLVKRQAPRNVNTESLELTSFMNVDVTQRSGSSQQPNSQRSKRPNRKKDKKPSGGGGASNKDGDCSGRKQSSRNLIRKKPSNDNKPNTPIIPNPNSCFREAASEYKGVDEKQRNGGGGAGEKEQRGSAAVVPSPTTNKPTSPLTNTDSSKRRKQRTGGGNIPVPSSNKKGAKPPSGEEKEKGKNDDKTATPRKKIKKKKPQFKNDDLTVDKTRELTKETISDKDDDSSGSDKHGAKSQFMSPTTPKPSGNKMKPRIVKSALSKDRKKPKDKGNSKESGGTSGSKSREAARRKPTKKR